MTVSNPQVKILKIYYPGSSTKKYGILDTAKQAGAEKGKKFKKDDVKIKVKDGDKVKKGEVIMNVGTFKVESEIGGEVVVEEKQIKVTGEVEKVKEFIVPKGVSILSQDGDMVEKGDQLTDGSLDLQQLFKLRGKLATQKYIIKEIQNVYSSQGQPLSDKHIEIVAKQMFSRFFVHDAGDTDLLPGEIVENSVLQRALDKMGKKGKEPQVDRLLLGIYKSSLTTDSFLSAASFQETARVLIEASVNGKIDYLEGLKENVIIGRLIPAGTGYKGKQERAKYD